MSLVFKDNTKEVAKKLQAAAKVAVMAGAERVLSQVKMLTPVDTGNLKGSMQQTSAKEQNGNVSTMVGSHADYAVYVEYGTGEFASNGQGRKGGWVYKAPDGKSYFTKGQKPARMLADGYKATREPAKKLMQRYFNKEMK